MFRFLILFFFLTHSSLVLSNESGALSKKYSYTKCLGDREICTIFNEGVLFTYDGDKVHWDDEFKKYIVTSPDVVAVMNEKFSKFGGNKLNTSLTIRLAGAAIVDFVAIGNFDKDPFEIESISVKYQGKDLAAMILEEI